MLPVFISFASSFLLVPCFTRAAQRYTSPMKPELEEHSFKAGIPSSGSFAILIAVLFSALFMKSSPYRGVYVLAALLFSAVGISDDVLKVVRKSPDGLKSLTKLFFQIAASAAVLYLIKERLALYPEVPSLIWYPAALLYMLLFTNGVNITDGLDSLAVKCSLPLLFMSAFLFASVREEALVLAAALLGFLWYNAPRASVFMGDGGSHLIGGLIALIGLLSGRPEVILTAGLIFIAELLSSFIQIFSIRVFRRKVFPIAPLHHCFQKQGMGEEKITDRAMIISFLFALLSVTLVKGRVV